MLIQSLTITGLVLLSGQALAAIDEMATFPCEVLFGNKINNYVTTESTQRRPLGESVNINNEGFVPCSFFI